MPTVLSQHRYAVIAHLANLYAKKGGWNLGKTALQKLVYFLQEVHGVDLGYEYTLYTYGPFSRALLADLNTAAAMDYVKPVYDAGFGGYQIKPGGESEALEKHTKDWLKSVNPKIEAVFDSFRTCGAKNLELRATIVYVAKDAQTGGELVDEDDLVSRVQQLKPYFDKRMIGDAIGELHNKGYLGAGGEAPVQKRSFFRGLARRSR